VDQHKHKKLTKHFRKDRFDNDTFEDIEIHFFLAQVV
jgi:hypothetical protein